MIKLTLLYNLFELFIHGKDEFSQTGANASSYPIFVDDPGAEFYAD